MYSLVTILKDVIVQRCTSCNSSVRLSVGDTLLLPYNSIDTTFTLYSNTRWRLSKLNPVDAIWVTSLSSGGVSNSDSLTLNRDARIMVNYSPNTSGESRTVRLLISFLDTMGNVLTSPVPDTLTLIQESAVPILALQSPSAVNVGYERDSVRLTFRFNTRWRLRKSDTSVNWITILSDGNDQCYG